VEVSSDTDKFRRLPWRRVEDSDDSDAHPPSPGPGAHVRV
jgi:hypothetical protein